MNYLSNMYEEWKRINPSNLSGAVDIIVVPQRDGTLRSTPFHVRFGKFHLFTPTSKRIFISVNGEKIDGVEMRLSQTGEAHFVRYEDSPIKTPKNKGLSKHECSGPIPIMSKEERKSTAQRQLFSLQNDATESLFDLSEENNIHQSKSVESGLDALGNSDFKPLTSSWFGIQNIPIVGSYFSPKKAAPSSSSSSPSTKSTTITPPQTTTPPSIKKTKTAMIEIPSSTTKKSRNNKKSSMEVEDSVFGGYLDDWEEEPITQKRLSISIDGTDTNTDIPNTLEDSTGESLNQSTKSKINCSGEYISEDSNNHNTPSNQNLAFEVEIARCQDLLILSKNNPEEAHRLFDEHKLPKEEFFNIFLVDANGLFDKDIIFRINGQYYPWIIAGPIILSTLIYKIPMPSQATDSLENEYLQRNIHEAAEDTNSTEYESSETGQYNGWLLNFFFNKKNRTIEPPRRNSTPTPKVTFPKSTPIEVNKQKESSIPLPRNRPSSDVTDEKNINLNIKKNNSLSYETSISPSIRESAEVLDSDEDLFSVPLAMTPTIFPTSKELESLNLVKGANKIIFSVEDSNIAISATIYLWDQSDKIVISDIDGTITKSDLFGHILPNLFGEDWSQPGVAQFLTNIRANGYQILYLTARAIGQAEITKTFLKNVNQIDLATQKEMRLPDGPVFMSPDRVFESLKREVILRCPEKFKVACLEEIQKLFEEPVFYAGFGNRHSDRISYEKVGIPPTRVFIIDEHGEIDNGNAIKKSYTSLNEIVDQIIPPFNQNSLTVFDDSYSDFKYWKSTNYECDLANIEEEIKKKKNH